MHSDSDQPSSANGAKQPLHEQAAYWLIRTDADNLSASEKEQFQSWLTEKPEHRKAFDEAALLWTRMDAVQDAGAGDGYTGKDGPVRDIPRQQPPAQRNRLRPAAIAASLIGIIAITAVHLDLPVLLLADHTTSVGETRIIRLPDGSTAHLNTGSAIQFAFSNGERAVALLKGEAAFKVQPGRSSPFRVTANGGTITALGTAFNVRLKDDKTIVTVSEHSVSVAVKTARRVILKEEQSVSYDESARLGDVRSVSTQNTLAWKKGKLVFKDTPLTSVISEINRYHSGHIRIVDSKIGNIRVNGVFDLTKPGAAIRILEKSLNLRAIRLTSYLILLTD